MRNSLGIFLEEIRNEKALSLRDVEGKSGLSFTFIRDLEIGINRKTNKPITPSPETLKKLADAYEIDYYELLERAGLIDSKYYVYDLLEMLKSKHEIYFDGVPINKEQRQRIADMLAGMFWHDKYKIE